MKKLLFFLITGLSFLSCSSDDNQVEETKNQELFLIVENTSIFVYDSLSFIIQDANADKVDAELYVNGVKASNPFVFDKEGQFEVIAKKKGALDSNTVKVNVGTKQLVLEVDRESLFLQGKTLFTAKWQGEDVSSKVTIYNVDTNEIIRNSVFTGESVGEFKFIAKGKGFIDSNMITINVEERQTDGKFIINDNEYLISGVSISVERMDVVNETDGEIFEIDKVFDLGNGLYANQYNFLFKSYQSGKLERVFFTFFVPNETIKVENGAIVDLGRRVFPNEVNSTLYFETWVVVDDYMFYSTFEESEAFLQVKSLQVKDKGQNAGIDGIDAEASLNISYKDFEADIFVDYTGKINFSEIPESNQSESAIRVKNAIFKPIKSKIN